MSHEHRKRLRQEDGTVVLVAMRLNRAENATIKRRAAALGLSIGEFVSQAAAHWEAVSPGTTLRRVRVTPAYYLVRDGRRYWLTHTKSGVRYAPSDQLPDPGGGQPTTASEVVAKAKAENSELRKALALVDF